MAFFIFIHIFNRKFCKHDLTPRSAASDLYLHGLSMSHKKDARLIWVKNSLHMF